MNANHDFEGGHSENLRLSTSALTVPQLIGQAFPNPPGR